jgi:C4-dicarboxylate transporter DctQ subunit
VRYLTRTMEVCLVAMFALYLAVVVGQVTLRFLRIDVLYFSEELVRYLLVWSVLIGATVVTARNAHVRVDILESLLPKGARRVLDILSALILIAFAVVLCWAGYQLAVRSGNMRAAMLGVKMSLVYSVIPATAALDVLFLLARIVHLVRNEPDETPSEDEEIDISL